MSRCYAIPMADPDGDISERPDSDGDETLSEALMSVARQQIGRASCRERVLMPV